MQIAAHYNAAIEILDCILDDVPAEKALLRWARQARFAGSKDRAAIRDIVYDALRKRASFAARFGLSGRGLALGRAWDAGELSLWDGENYAPDALSEEEKAQAEAVISFANLAEEYDFPEFLQARLEAQYGKDLPELMSAMRARAPVDLRVNVMKASREKAADFLARDHIFTDQLPFPTALRVALNPRRLSQSKAYNYGFVELQDVSSQMIAAMAQARAGMEVLDYCAGGGGKALAMAMHMNGEGRLDAWDISQARMKEIPERAARAGVKINVLDAHPTALYDLVFVDAPCSGSGAWRRTPDAKWRLDAERLQELQMIQSQILAQAANHVKPGGSLLYATCSILKMENQERVAAFLERNAEFEQDEELALTPLNGGGDGFYACRMIRT